MMNVSVQFDDTNLSERCVN